MVDASQPVASYLFSRTRLLFLLLLMPSMAASQNPGWWGNVDTVTTGDCDDTHPTLIHNAFFDSTPDRIVRTIFERRTATESQIVSKRFNMGDQAWDTSEVVVSHSPLEEPQADPDYAEQYISAYPYAYTRGYAVWQRFLVGRWKLFYSMRDTLDTWTPPALLYSDSLNMTDAKILPFHDSTFLITWRRANTILATRLSSLGTGDPETLAVGTTDSMQYDICNTHGRIQIAWTSGSPPEIMVLSRWINSYWTASWSPPETTLSHLSLLPNPHLFVGYGNSSWLYERRSGTTRDLFLTYGWSEPSEWNISEDSTSEDVNGRAFQAPFITKRDAHRAGSYPWTDIIVYEKHRTDDSAMVFLNYGYSDTVRSQGHNRNVCVGSQLCWSDGYEHLLIVWESNRTGRSHIYSRMITIIVGDVEEPPNVPLTCMLHQNYPNPFNPGTTLQFSIGAVSREPLVEIKVRLAVYDMLGREVAVLVNEGKQPGNYEVSFDGAGLASGVYLCRLTAGEYTASRRMVLLR
jgi:hypothetical protein